LNSTSYQSFYSPNTFQFGGEAAQVANYPMGGYPRPTMLNESKFMKYMPSLLLLLTPYPQNIKDKPI
jgi:hypothetical protein